MPMKISLCPSPLYVLYCFVTNNAQQHPADPIVIESVGIAIETTEFEGNVIWEPIPQQLHTSRVEALRLEPGAVAIVPLTFLPRYPHDALDVPEQPDVVYSRDSAPLLSTYQYTDLTHLVGSEALEGQPCLERRRNNLDYNTKARRSKGKLYEVHTSILVETSRGTSVVPLSASSVRSNHYRVPERIRFRPPPITLKRETTNGARRWKTVDRSRGEQVSVLPSNDCYDLYLYNPRTEALHISEVTISKPDSVALFNLDLDGPLRNATRIRNDAGREIQVVKHGETQYITTVCPLNADFPSNWMLKPRRPGDPWQIDYSQLDINLGYLQVKTEQDTLFILLEWYLTIEHLQQEADRQTEYDNRKQRPPRPKQSKLKARPAMLSADLVPSISATEKIMVSIQNIASAAVKVMRISLLIDEDKAKVLNRTGTQLNLKSKLEPSCNATMRMNRDEGSEYLECKESGIIDGNSFWTDAMHLEVRIDSNLTMEYLRSEGGLSEMTGSVVVTGTTDITSSYEDWLGLMKRNPYNSEKVTMEIPWTVKLVDGRLYAVMANSTSPNVHLRHDIVAGAAEIEAVDAFFFPFEPLDLRDLTYWPGIRGRMYDYDPEGMSHTVRIIAQSNTRLTIAKLRIERDKSDPHSRVCERFKFTTLAPLSPEKGYSNDVGGIKVDYDFSLYRDQFRRREGKGELLNVIYPTVCLLTFETEPIQTGEHVIDLIVFTGKLDVSTGDPGVHIRSDGVSDSPFTPRGKEYVIAASLLVGFDRAMSWFESSALGSTLLKHLRRKSMFGRWTSAASLFREYVMNLANVTEGGVYDREGFVDPIIMHAGAIAYGETLTMPLQITNHNPVPVQVFLDVGEVEGMRISISRETSRLRGDGNSMLDFFPHRIPPGLDRIGVGAWLSHSREGLKNFLVNSDFALSFFNFLPHRDAIEVSSRATSRLPILRSLFKKRAKATFHADMHPLSFYTEKMSGCDGDEKNPSNYIKVEERVQGWPGPLLLSDDGLVAHSNTVCDPDFLADISSYPRSANMMYLKQTPVTIPPGGVARFDVKIRAPEKDSLSKDVTPFLSTGLVISTDHGQVSPIIVTFEALLGQLKLSHGLDWIGQVRSWQNDDKFSHQYSGEVVEVPLRLFQTFGSLDLHPNKTGISISPSPELPPNANLTTWISPAGASGVPLYLSSSFSRDVVLRDIVSCNPWFYIDLRRPNSTTNTGSSVPTDRGAVEIGTLHTSIICPTMQDLLDTFHEIEIPEHYPVYPSFYQCALEWLENRTLLQSFGCGARAMPKNLKQSEYGADDDATERALDALNHAITFSMFKYGNGRLKYETGGSGYDSNAARGEHAPKFNSTSQKTGGARGSSLIDRLTLDIYAEITDAWRVISELDLHSITSSFRATLEYSYSDNNVNKTNEVEEPQSLTVSMRDAVIRTKLAMPQLVKPMVNYTYHGRNDQENDFFSVFEFPPTAVADAVSLMLPLRNPTGIPVKVKLSTISWEEIIRDAQKAEDFNTLATDEVRERYLNRYESVFTQTGFESSMKSPGHSWWEGNGAFFHADDQGQLVQSRHNITITVGSKSKVSLINPWLFAHSAFTIGCGRRCGLREEGDDGNVFESGLRKTSPIGASAAAGAALVGRPRAEAGGEEASDNVEQTLSPGGTAFLDAAPPAFAIPYSAFDEIILPPYGEAEIGPIFFRPPGRYGLMGCDAVVDNDAIPFSEKVAETCSSTVFQSMVFLENSLTGLERVVLRGKGMWESIVFLDPIGSDSVDAFGDLELRNGHVTLMFPGSCVSNQYSGTSPHAVTKGVIVQNDGDLDVVFSRVFFTDSSKLGKKKGGAESSSHGCSYRGFRLLECSEREGSTFGVKGDGDGDDKADAYELSDNDANLFRGFKVPAGSNKTIFIEHSADCTFQSDYVALNFEFKREPMLSREGKGSPPVFLAPDGSRARSRASESLHRKNLKLLVGFDMSSAELKACVPIKFVHSDAAYVSGSRNISLWNNRSSISSSELTRLQRAISIGQALRHHLHGVVELRCLTFSFLIAIASIAAAAFLIALVSSIIVVRSSWSKSFTRKIKLPRGLSGRASSFDGNVAQSSWSSTFRCLARADPTSSELQTISREQVKQIVLHRFKAAGVMMPQCIDATGTFNREGGGQNLRNGKGCNASKTLSEAIFHRCNFISDREGTALLMPCGLGWRSPIARRIIQTDLQPSVKLRSDSVLSTRRGMLDEDDGSGGSLASAGREATVKGPVPQKGAPEMIESDLRHSGLAPRADVSTNETPIPQPDPLAFSEFASAPQLVVDGAKVEDNTNKTPIKAEERLFANEGQGDVRLPGDVPPKSMRENTLTENQSRKNRESALPRVRPVDAGGVGSSSVSKTRRHREKRNASSIPDKPRKEKAESNRTRRRSGNATEKSKRLADAPSSPSSAVSASSRSTKTDTTTSPILTPIDVGRTRAFRPPPGLPPPPGFGDIGSATAMNLSTSSILGTSSLRDLPYSVQSNSQSLSALLPSLDQSISLLDTMRSDSSAALDQLYSASSPTDITQNSSSLFHRIRDTDERNLEISATSLHHDSISSIDPSTQFKLLTTVYPEVDDEGRKNGNVSSRQQRLDSSGGFDVMGFLDNLLDESPGNESLSAAAPLLEDPWALGRQSRAAAYGIFVESHAGEVREDESGIVQASFAAVSQVDVQAHASTVVIPLLTPAALGNSAVSVFGDDDEVAPPPQDYDSGDFYAKLLGE